MKKSIYIFGLVLVLLGCSKEMELPYDGRISKDKLFSDFDATRGMLNRAYGFMPGDYSISLASYCDEAQDASYSASTSNGFRDWYDGRVTSSNWPLQQMWGGSYEGIRACNVFLEGIKNTTLNLKPEVIAEWVAQARVLRAYYYLQIIKRYGFAVLLEKELTMEDNFAENRKSSFCEVARFIISECDNALKEPSSVFKWRFPGSLGNIGTMTRGVAYAIKSQTALYAASPLYNDGSFTWKDVTTITADALDKCTNNGELNYTLYSNYAEYFSISIDATQSQDRETILSTKNQLEIWKFNGHPTTRGMEKAGSCPTQELVDSYEMAGTGISPILGYKDTKHLRPIYNPLVFKTVPAYDTLSPYLNRDPRLKASIYYYGNNVSVGECLTSPDEARITQTKTGYYLAKFNQPTSNIDSNNDGYMKIFRLGELYLNFAEAANEAFGPSFKVKIGSGKLSAVDAVNIVRDRVGMPPFGGFDGDDSSVNKDAFRIKYRNERRIELAFELHRFFDVRRWQKPSEDLSATDEYLTGIRIGSYKRFALPRRFSYDNKFLLTPLPSDENSKIMKFTGESWQNPGW